MLEVVVLLSEAPIQACLIFNSRAILKLKIKSSLFNLMKNIKEFTLKDHPLITVFNGLYKYIN